ncbi:unnamed protein product, partial [Rotaria sp. Silwood2]
MDAFTSLDICNMDESSLELFRDQSKRSINDIGTSIDIEGNLINKQLATLILTVFDAHPELLKVGSANSYLNADVIRGLCKKLDVVIMIPKSCT